jgi:hypothetical protein
VFGGEALKRGGGDIVVSGFGNVGECGDGVGMNWPLEMVMITSMRNEIGRFDQTVRTSLRLSSQRNVEVSSLEPRSQMTSVFEGMAC